MRRTTTVLLACGVLAACTQPAVPEARPQARAVASATPSARTPVAPPRAAAAQDVPSSDNDPLPARFQGLWAADAAACGRAGDPSRLAIDGDSLKFHESQGPVTRATVRDNALQVRVMLTGEGQTREATYRYTLSGDGTALVDADAGMVRHRCGT